MDKSLAERLLAQPWWEWREGIWRQYVLEDRADVPVAVFDVEGSVSVSTQCKIVPRVSHPGTAGALLAWVWEERPDVEVWRPLDGGVRLHDFSASSTELSSGETLGDACALALLHILGEK